MVTAAAVGVAAFGVSALVATPAWAADPLEIRVDNSVQGKVGDKIPVRFTVKNNTKQPVAGITVVMQAPANAVVDGADNPGCSVGGGGRAVSCRSTEALAAGRSAAGQIVITARTAGQAGGRVQVEHGNADNFVLRASGGPTPTASGREKPSRTASASVSDTPAFPDETLAPPQAGNGAIPQTTTEPATNRASSGGGGLSIGFWIGIVAIVGALGLVGSLFYFRRKDRDDPDVDPPPFGQPATYGTPGVYGSPPQSSPTQVIGPQGGGADQTVIFRRPDQY
ncbi:hypothetical protein [Dactylosporangium sp. CA-092794]|uniref:hypothetical protein n=1 Tax=Dactylosporangium sp. CA-092794 TaxID=3239929 RepID=UPI003D906078